MCNELAGLFGACLGAQASAVFVSGAGKGPHCDVQLPVAPELGMPGGLWRAQAPRHFFVGSACPANARRVGDKCACLPGFAQQAKTGADPEARARLTSTREDQSACLRRKAGIS